MKNFDKFYLIIMTNVVVCAGSALCISKNFIVICIGRFFTGVAVGAFTVFCPRFINEIAPTEIKGMLGSMNQVMCTLGIFTTALLGLAIPADVATTKTS
jgi:MFS family permease